MAGEWRSIRLGDVAKKIGSGATPRGGSDVYLQQGPYSLIRSQNIYNDGFHHDGLAFIGEKHAAELENVEVLKDDVLLNITGDSVARACQVDPEVLPARVNQHVAIIRPDPRELAPRFLRFVLASPDMQTKLLSWAGSGGTRNALTKGIAPANDAMGLTAHLSEAAGSARSPAATLSAPQLKRNAFRYVQQWFDDGAHQCIGTFALVPIVSSFFGIVIRMFYSEHAPPHFHVEYQGQDAEMSLDGEVLHGQIRSARARRLIRRWGSLHRAELAANWARVERGQPLERIPPLE